MRMAYGWRLGLLLQKGAMGSLRTQCWKRFPKSTARPVAQVVLRWHHQRGVVAIPRSSNPEHRRENLAIFDFSLTADDMNRISALDENRSQFPEWT